MNEKNIVLAALTLLVVAGISIPFTLRLVHPASLDGIKFCTICVGYSASVEGDVIIKDANTGQIYLKGPMPSTGVVCFQVACNTELLILWKDWRGQMSERHVVLCTPDGTDELVNCIPFPKSM